MIFFYSRIYVLSKIPSLSFYSYIFVQHSLGKQGSNWLHKKEAKSWTVPYSISSEFSLWYAIIRGEKHDGILLFLKAALRRSLFDQPTLVFKILYLLFRFLQVALKRNIFMKQSARLSKYSQMYLFCKPCIPEPLFQIPYPRDLGHADGNWLSCSCTAASSGQNHTGNVEWRMFAWSQSFSGKSPLRLNGAEVSSVVTIDPRAIIDPGASMAYSNSSQNRKVTP